METLQVVELLLHELLRVVSARLDHTLREETRRLVCLLAKKSQVMALIINMNQFPTLGFIIRQAIRDWYF